jgi:hypothetical protein
MRAWARLLYLVSPIALLIAVALAFTGCTRGGGQFNGPVASYGTLAGGIMRRPTSGENRPGAPPSVLPVAGAELKIIDLKGAVVATARTDSSGLYRATLPPGNYRVGRGAGFLGAARNLPAIVAISPGGQTRLDIWIDSEIRAPGGSAATR